jgi:hypothetical protein
MDHIKRWWSRGGGGQEEGGIEWTRVWEYGYLPSTRGYTIH